MENAIKQTETSQKISIEFKGKKEFVLPKGGKIVKKECRVSVEEIKNGFLVTKNWEIQWKNSKEESQWDYHDEKWFSETNILENKINEELSLIDRL